MNIQVGDRFEILKFTAIAEYVAENSVFFELAHVSQSGFTRSGFGHAAVMLACKGQHENVLLLSLPEDLHGNDTLVAIQKRLFDILSLTDEHSFYLQLSPPPLLEAHGPDAGGYVSF